MKSFDSLQPLTLLFLRAVLALIFITSGYPKLTGTGPIGQQFFVQHGLPGEFVYVAGVLEVFGGALLVLGLFTRWAALLLTIDMGVVIWKVHLASGYLAVHEYAYPLVLAAACLALVSIGPGFISMDYPLFGGGKSRQPRNHNK